ncbi:MAG: hypothetical protein HFJ12_06245 [Bacilli bacterium]|nr:hypothetical protein [Bacilli bacterium]
MKSIIIGAETDLGVHIDGAKLGPVSLIKDLGSFYQGEIIEFKQDEAIIKSRNLSDRAKNKYEINQINEKIYKKILEKMGEGFFPITIGGDKSIIIPAVLADAMTNEEIGLIIIGAHADYNTFKTTETGNMNGFSTSCITGFECEDLRQFHRGEIVQASKTVLVGVRNMNQKEQNNLKYSGISVFTTEDLKQQGAKEVIEKAFEIASYKTKNIHICYDLNILDPTIAPGISVPEFNGIDEELAMNISDEILKYFDKISAYDLVELNPLRDQNRKTEQIALNILFKTLKEVEKLPDKKIEELY